MGTTSINNPPPPPPHCCLGAAGAEESARVLRMNSKTHWETVCQLQTAADFSDFLGGVDVWIRRPHVVNKRLLGASILQERAVCEDDGGSGQPTTGSHQDHPSSRQLLRELIPRGNGPSIKELVTVGKAAVSVHCGVFVRCNFCPAPDEASGTCLFSSLAPPGPLSAPGGGYLIRYEYAGPGEQARSHLISLQRYRLISLSRSGSHSPSPQAGNGPTSLLTQQMAW